jgi:arylsulfatase A-like enzyme
LRQDHLGTYGYGRETDPLLQRLAEEGTLFEDCQVEGTWTKVSAPSLFASLHPLSHGVTDFDHRLPASATTVGEAYRDGGHSTLLLSSIIFTGKFSNLHQGFQEVHEAASLEERRSSKTTAELVNRLIPWLERHRDAPFFVVLHVLDPHDPYRPKPPYDTLWADGDRAEEHEARTREVRAAIADPLLQVFGMPSREEVAAAGFDPDDYIGYETDWYDGAIRGMDDALAKLMAFLGESGLDRRTVIAFTSDHGEEFFDHGRMFHGQSLYGELTNVPLILWGPGRIPAGAVVRTPVQTVDVMPTLLDLSGLQVPEEAQGRSLTPLMEAVAAGLPEPASAARPVFSTRAATQDLFGPPPRAKEAYSVILDGWKLIHNVRGVEGDPEFELYDHAADPLDLNDVAPDHPEVVERLAGVLTRWRKSAEAERLPLDHEAASSLTGAELERLRSLGYIE